MMIIMQKKRNQMKRMRNNITSACDRTNTHTHPYIRAYSSNHGMLTQLLKTTLG